ncbi:MULTISPECIES: hypothetical protein [Marinilabiliaceae]|uniref:Uncharacterized protein n=1 Tax=Plebeiibacterium marinum TaxID=2992111 RepID=A0AAE3MH82_9BACT|nr:hypothetical protein [Plebeiobacterium marinum]MCU4166546.1 hypothetical protein [Marinilabiliaceae bacterium A049]MCW3807435.1 hypothetical protein [Plebeiobacterium marinum]
MKNKVLKHLTVIGFVKGEDLTKCESLEKKMDEAKEKLNYARKEVDEAKQKLILAKKELSESKKKLDIALDESLEKIEKEKDIVPGGILFSRGFSTNAIKNKYEDAIAELELKKNEISKRIETYKNDGSEKWDSFKQKLNHDMEELGKALKSFTVYNQ